jgi:hypothetical protein
VVHVVRWRLPGDRRAPPTPKEKPLLEYPYLWAKYHNPGTGFTGDLQRISHWKKSSTKRVQLPDRYKGAMGRFPSGELVVASYVEAKPRHSRIYRSADNGATWTKVDGTGATLLGKEPSIVCLNDNKTVLLKTQIVGQPPYSPLYRSADGGATWSEIDYGQRSLSYPRNLIQFSDGSIAMFNSNGNYAEAEGAENTKAWRIRSFDGGLTWPERKEVSGVWERPRPFFTEATFLAISDTHLLAAARVNGDQVHSVTGEIPPMGLGHHNAEINQKMAFIESTDGGLSWSRERFVFAFGDVQAKFLQLADGRILCTYRCRSELPFGVKGVFSQDGGKTWDLDFTVILGMHSTIFRTWQHDIQLPDGTMRTAWARIRRSANIRGRSLGIAGSSAGEVVRRGLYRLSPTNSLNDSLPTLPSSAPLLPLTAYISFSLCRTTTASCSDDVASENSWHPDDYVYRPSVEAKGNALLSRIIKNGKRDGTADQIAAAKMRLSKMIR